MRDTPVILHHEEGSVGSTRARKIFALKCVAWRSCPLDCDSDDGSPIGRVMSGAMGRPILQQGRSLWVSGLAVIDALEEMFPNPTLFPNGNRGMPLALSWWADEFAATTDADQALAYAHLIERQLADGRDFLQGKEAGLADVQAFSGLGAAPESTAGAVLAWQARMDALGEGQRVNMTRAEALAEPTANDNTGTGERIQISDLGSGAAIEGDEIASGPDGLVIQINGATRVHFPAIGYAAESV